MYGGVNFVQEEIKRYTIMIKIVVKQLFITQWTGYSFLLGIITGVLAWLFI